MLLRQLSQQTREGTFFWVTLLIAENDLDTVDFRTWRDAKVQSTEIAIL